MRREELCHQLNRPYTDELGYGIEKVSELAFKNEYFVVPPPPPEVAPSGMNMQSLAKAFGALMQRPEFDSCSESDRIVNFYCLRQEAVQSSRMEGTWSTIDALFKPDHPDTGRSGEAFIFRK